MMCLTAGLLIFLGMHSARMFFPNAKLRITASAGAMAWKGLYALVSVVGLVLIIVGYGDARMSPLWVWYPPMWMNHITMLLMLFSFIFLAATYIPGNHIKAAVGHPMLIAVKIWALAHLLSNPTTADILLFGTFLMWAVSLFRHCRREDKVKGTTYPSAGIVRDVIVLVVGVGAYGAFAMVLHQWLIGVSPLPLV
jgi:uncharacterized membrane protein